MFELNRRKLVLFALILIIIFITAYCYLEVSVLQNLNITLQIMCELAIVATFNAIGFCAFIYYYRKQINTDSLTKLNSREKLTIDLEKRTRRNKDFAIAYIDLDGFKQINDTQGHKMGNKVLKEFAKRVSGISGITGYRNGGDEFILIIDQDESENIEEKLEEIISIKAPREEGCYKGEIAFSMGIAFYPKNATVRKDLLKVADEAMYASKKQGLPYCIAKE